MIIYGLKNCSTCRAALKALPGAQMHDVRDDAMDQAVLARAFDLFGDKILNTRSTTWRELDAAARSGAPLDLIAAHPTLMKRPLIADGDALYLGWDKTTQAALGVA